MGSNFLASAASGSAANSGFEGSIGTWNGGTGAPTLTDSAAQAHSGLDSLSIVATTSGNMTVAHCTTGNILSQGISIRAGQTLFVAGWFRANTVGRNCKSGAQFFDVTGTLIGAAVLGTGINDTTTGWVNPTASLVAPAKTFKARAFMQVPSAAGAGEQHFLDDVVMYVLSKGAVPYLPQLLELVG